MVPPQVYPSLHAIAQSEGDIELMFFTYAAGTAFRPGLLIVAAPGADDGRLAQLEETTKTALGDYAQTIPVLCCRDVPDEYATQARMFIHPTGPA